MNTPATLWDGTPLRRRSYSFSAEETALIHYALRAAFSDRVRHPYTDPKMQRAELHELAALLTKIDGRLRPIG